MGHEKALKLMGMALALYLTWIRRTGLEPREIIRGLETVHIARIQCLLNFGRAFSAGSLYPRYVRLYNCTRDRSHHQSSVGEGFQVAGSPDPEAERHVCLALEVILQRYVKSTCTRSSTVFCHQRTAESTVLMYR